MLLRRWALIHSPNWHTRLLFEGLSATRRMSGGPQTSAHPGDSLELDLPGGNSRTTLPNGYVAPSRLAGLREWQSNWYSPSTSTSATTTANIFIMNIDSRYPLGHKLLLAGAESVPQVTLTRVAGYRRSHRGRDNAQLFAQSRTLRIRQANSLDFSTAGSTSPLRTLLLFCLTLSNFHGFCGPQALRRQARTIVRTELPGIPPAWLSP